MKREWKLIVLGGVSPLIGVLIYLFQMQINPHGLVRYTVAQAIISVGFLSYFFLCAYFLLREPQEKNGFYFFVIPVILCFVNIFISAIQRNAALAAVAAGVMAPFHYVMPYLYLNFPPLDEHLFMSALPVILCWISFKMGERASVRWKAKKVV